MHTIWIVGGALFLFALWMFEVDGRWIGAGAAALVAWTFNSIVSARNQADTAFSSIGVMLKKRYDLIPNLVAAVQRYVEHEAGLLDRVTQLRAEATAGRVTPQRAAELDQQIGRALSQIVATAEGYPELKASENFQQLQRALSEAEEQISAARRSYNAAVKSFNDMARMFPTNLFCRLAGWSERPYFEIPAGHDERPDVAAAFRSAGRG